MNRAAVRNGAFERLLSRGEISEARVDGLSLPLYIASSSIPLLEGLLSPAAPPLRGRCEFLAPLDPLLWDRRLIRELFGFDYTWEIYTPAEKRKYGVYTLPILSGERFAGRIDAAADRRRGVLTVKNVYYESGVRRTKKLDAAISSAARRLARLNGCKSVEYL